jgi:hypothetical protein
VLALEAANGRTVKVLVCGSRSWNDYATIRRRLAKFEPGVTVIHGAARGADQKAAIAARALGIPETPFPADWRGNGRRAGIIRNLAMLNDSPDLVLAFWDGRSTGTKHTIDEAHRRGIPVEVHDLSR